ncbi:MAG TPA: glycosyltransferase family 4 protein [Anaerolineales bacterium]|nr:glycosyltransferase family 4 protein [Anaerolineales bacterium]
MKICLISVEIFAWGKYGGFGRSTRMIGRELVKRGIEVTAIVPRRDGQKPIEILDGIRVLGFEPYSPLSAIKLAREADADIYHSQEPSFGTYLAQWAMPHRKHIITFRDTRNIRDWWIEFVYPSLNHLQVVSNFLYEDNFLVRLAVRRADDWFAASKALISKARRKYRLPRDPTFLPSPIPFVEVIQKSETPLVCFVGRLDRRKRPHIFFELARQFPKVHFVAVGAGRDTQWERELRSKYGNIPNLSVHGFVDQFGGQELSELFNKAWVLVNTSARESLPTTFVEAAAHGCAILSEIDPDGFASQYGYHVTDGDYAKGLRKLLQNDNWREKGQVGLECTRRIFSLEVSMQKHIQIYEGLLSS